MAWVQLLMSAETAFTPMSLDVVEGPGLLLCASWDAEGRYVHLQNLDCNELLQRRARVRLPPPGIVKQVLQHTNTLHGHVRVPDLGITPNTPKVSPSPLPAYLGNMWTCGLWLVCVSPRPGACLCARLCLCVCTCVCARVEGGAWVGVGSQ